MMMLAAVLTAVPAPVRALVFGHDRVTVPTDPSSIFSPIGIVYGTAEAGYATAFLIDDCHALTVQHVFGVSRSAVGRRVYFAAGVSGPFATWRVTVATVIAEGGAQGTPSGPDALHKWTADWTLLRLHRCLGRTFGHVTLTSAVPSNAEAVQMAGYPSDRPLSAGLALDPLCHARERRGGVLLHDCATLPGNSGSPLFRIGVLDGRPVMEVFAIDAAGYTYSDLGADPVHPVVNYMANYANFAATLCGPLKAYEGDQARLGEDRRSNPTGQCGS